MSVKISTITRTKDRPALLSRALDSLLQQDRKPDEWVIVNEGGALENVQACADRAKGHGIEVVLLDNETAVGRGAAANQGVKASSGDLVHLHDDDDTLHPGFYAQTEAFLIANPHYRGVVTWIEKILETQNEDGRLEERGRALFNPGLKQVTIIDLCYRNLMAPIGFVFHRDAYDQCGGYAEDLPVMEDWVFVLNFIRRFDMGVIDRPIAYYHLRQDVSDTKDPLANTVVAGIEEHHEYDAIVRNRFLREDLDAGKPGIGFLMNPPHRQAANRINQLVDRYRQVEASPSFAGWVMRRLKSFTR